MDRSPKILIVDDDAHDVELILAALQGVDLAKDAAVASGGVVALDYLFRRGAFAERPPGHPVVVLLDLKMPRVDGMEVLRRLKSDPALAVIPVVVFTSSPQDSDVSTAYRLGANAYVVKPVEFHQFMQAITQIAAFWLTINQPPMSDAA